MPFDHISSWFDPSTLKMWSNGIQALLPLIEDASYDNLPPVYNAVHVVVETAPSALQNDLVELIRALYTASPVETTYFVRQTITGSASPQLPQTFRRILPALPQELQPVILELIRRKAACGEPGYPPLQNNILPYE